MIFVHPAFQLSKEDVNRLKIDVPGLAMSLTVPELDQIANLFARYTPKSQKSIDKNNAAIENQLVKLFIHSILEGSCLIPTLVLNVTFISDTIGDCNYLSKP